MKKMSKGMLMAALICGVVQWGGTPVHASELQEFALDEYVVTAARTETKLVDTPANISVVDAQTIEERHYQDVSEVLKDVPGANVIDTGVGAYEKVVRLNGDDRVLILVDGRRVNIDMGTMSRASFDLNQLPDIGLIERIEVLKGAGGALYGSDAVGGVINVITKKADIGYGKVNVSVGSNDYNNFSTMYTFKANKTGMTVSASKEKQDYYKFRDIKTDTTKRWHGQSDFENEKFSLKITQEINDSNYLEAGHDYSKYDGNSPSFSTYNQVMCLNKLEKETSNSFLKYNWTINESDEGYFQYYHNETDYANLGIQGVISTGYMNEKVNGIDIQQALSITDNNKIVFGTSWRKSDVVTKGSNNYDESIDNLAFFINDIWEFSSNWALNTGIRYDNHSEAGDETTFSLGLNKKISDNSHVYFNWGEVFKAPTTDDLFYDDGGYSFGNENLKPETGETWTIGYTTMINDRTKFGISYFESDLEDAINWAYDDNPEDGWEPSYVENLDKQKKKGFELSLDHKINDNFALEGSYTYLNVKEKEGNSKSYSKDPNAIPNSYRLGLKYNDNKWNANLYMRAGSGASSKSYLDSNYITIDLAVTYEASKNLSIYAKGYNLFNEAYAEQAGHFKGQYYSPAQSRRFIVGAEYKF